MNVRDALFAFVSSSVHSSNVQIKMHFSTQIVNINGEKQVSLSLG